MNPRRILSQAALIIGAMLFAVGLQAFAFTPPACSPPNCDASAPINVGPYSQSKGGGVLTLAPDTKGVLGALSVSGGIIVNTGNQNGLASLNGFIVANGNVGIGVTAPSTALEVAQNKAIKVGNAYLSSGGDYVHLANNEWYDGSKWTTNGLPGMLIQLTGQNLYVYSHDASTPVVHTLQFILNSSGITFPDGTVQKTAYTGGSATVSTGSQTFTYPDGGTWAQPAGVSNVYVTICGGGGGGSGAGGGGGGGVCYDSKLVHLTGSGQSIPVTVGAGGSGGVGTSGWIDDPDGTSHHYSRGSAGGTSSFGGYLSAAGGGGGLVDGTGGSGGSGGGCGGYDGIGASGGNNGHDGSTGYVYDFRYPDTKYAGCTNSGKGNGVLTGGVGGDGGDWKMYGGNFGGGGGGGGWGSSSVGGNGGDGPAVSGANGTGYASGGGGGSATPGYTHGGNGAPGIVIVTW